ncbi:MAG: hypothetical protein Q9181_006556 [Wetmoreana brouardii]
MYPLLERLTRDYKIIRSMVPRYLFRVFSAKSQGSKSDQGFIAHSTQPISSDDDFRQKLSDHLSWREKASPFISSTSSLLRALVFARWSCLQGHQDVRIAMINSDLITTKTVFPATYLVKEARPEPSGKPWHDNPEGEFLTLKSIQKGALLGETSYEDISPDIETLLPELMDKSYQLTEDLREYYHKPQNVLIRAEKQKAYWPISVDEYNSARKLARAFNVDHHSLLLTLMILSFRKRDSQALDKADFAWNFPGEITDSPEPNFITLTKSRHCDVRVQKPHHPG